MSEFHLRIWQEQTLFDCRDYTVAAATLGEAARLLWRLHGEAVDSGEPIAHNNVRALERGCLDEVRELDPEEIVDSTTGLTLIDETGKRLRDLGGVPTGCVRLGAPMEDLEP